VLDQAKPHSLGNILGFRSGEPEAVEHGSEQR
jgi:hypothetical protein